MNGTGGIIVMNWDLAMKKTIKIKIDVKPIWKIGMGHNDHISGSGKHDNRPKRARTRKAAFNNAMKEYD